MFWYEIKKDKTLVKTSVNGLALFGGQAAFDEALHVGRPNIGERGQFLARVNEMFDQRRLSNNGPFARELEEKLAAFLGVKHCIAVCNATIALEIAARALGLRGEVIIPSFTFVASAHALQWQEINSIVAGRLCCSGLGRHHIFRLK